MTIGNLLKQYRQKAGKTQRAWIGDIVSPSFYSKVEKNTTRISAQDLIELLRYNHVNLERFFSTLDYRSKPQEDLKKSVLASSIDAYYQFDIAKLQSIKDEVIKSDVSDKDDLLLKLNSLIYTAQNSPEGLSPEEKDLLKNKFYNEENLNKKALKNFCNYMYFFDFNSNLTITRKILKKFKNSSHEDIQFLVLDILINMIGTCIANNSYDKAKELVNESKEIPTKPINCFSKIMLLLLENLVNYRYDPKPVYLDICKLQVKELSLIGMTEFSKQCQQLLDENNSKHSN